MTIEQIQNQPLSQEAAGLLEASVFREEDSVLSKDMTIRLSQMGRWFDMGLDPPDSSSGKARRPYAQVELVFTCVEKIIAAMQALPLVLSTIDEQIVESGPVHDLFFNNPLMTWEQIVTEAIGHWSLSRDVFFIFTDMAGPRPKEFKIVNGRQMRAITDDNTADGNLIAWEFLGPGGNRIVFDPEEVLQWKNYNPYDRFHGLGPLEAATNSYNYSYAAALYNASVIDNGADPGIVLVAPGRVDPEEGQMLVNQFDTRHRGPSKAKRTALVTGGMKVETVALKMTDMQMAKIVGLSDNKICATIGVPPGVAGLITEAQYSHGPAQRNFIFNTILPLSALFGGVLTSGLTPRFYSSDSRGVPLSKSKTYFGRRSKSLRTNKYFRSAANKAVSSQQKLIVWFDSSQHPDVAEYDEEMAEKVLKLTESGVPLNNLIEAHDLPYEEQPWGDDHLVPMGVVPARWIIEAGPESIADVLLPEGEGEEETEPEKLGYLETLLDKAIDSINKLKQDVSVQKAGEADKKRIWQRYKDSWRPIELQYNKALRTRFIHQRDVLLRKLKAAFKTQDSGHKTQDARLKAPGDDIIARVVFDLKFEDGKLKVTNHTFFDKASELGIRQGISEITGASGDKLTEAAEIAKRQNFVRASLVRSSNNIKDINKATQQKVAEQLKEGLDAGEGLKDLTARVKSTMKSRLGTAQRIARTQTAGAVGTGRHAGFKHSGVKKKSWLTSRDDSVRESHKAAEAKYAAGIPIDQAFEIGSSLLMYPGDPAGQVADIVNCRCAELAVVTAGKTFDLPHYSNLNFYSYDDMIKDKDNGSNN